MKKEFIFNISKNMFDGIEFTCNDIIAEGGVACDTAQECHNASLIYNNIIEWHVDLEEEQAKQRCDDYGIRVIFKGAD